MSQVPGGSQADNNVSMPTIQIDILDASFTAALNGQPDYVLERDAAAGWAKFEIVHELIRKEVHDQGIWMDCHTKVLTNGQMAATYKYFSGAKTVAPYADAAGMVAAIIAGTSLTAADVQV